jgi:hypothetical protein
MDDREAAEFYGRSGAIKAGARVPIEVRRMTGHVPVRFPSATIEQIKSLAAEDGMSVSAWIRGVVDKAIKRRVGQQTVFTDDTRLTAADCSWMASAALTETSRLVDA